MNVHGTGRTVFTLVLAAQLGGCGEGWYADQGQARQWLPTAKPHLEKVLMLLRTCQPRYTRSESYRRIWVEDDNGGAGPAHCVSGQYSSIHEIKAALNEAGALSVEYVPDHDPERPVQVASFMLFRAGMGISGSLISINYYSKPLPCVETVDEYQSRQPLTTAPCRWFWERSLG